MKAFLDMCYCRLFLRKDCFRMNFCDNPKYNDILVFPEVYPFLARNEYRYLYRGWIVRQTNKT